MPLLPGVRALASQGFVTGASGSNWAADGAEVALPAGFAPEDQALPSDPPLSGGLLVACAPEAVGAVVDVFRRHGFAQAAPIGEVLADPNAPRLQLR